MRCWLLKTLCIDLLLIPTADHFHSCFPSPVSWLKYCCFFLNLFFSFPVYVLEDADSGGDSQEESGLDDQEEPPFVPPPGYIMYTVLPDGSPVPQGVALYAPSPPLPNSSHPLTPGTVVYGPPPAGAPIIYGPPPANFAVPLVPAGVQHCNIPEHHNLVSGDCNFLHIVPCISIYIKLPHTSTCSLCICKYAPHVHMCLYMQICINSMQKLSLVNWWL